jgi:hypothetical protein
MAETGKQGGLTIPNSALCYGLGIDKLYHIVYGPGKR